MVTNVSEKDKALQEIIDWCEQLEVEGLRLANDLLMQHDIGLRVKLDTNETYYLKSGWKERGDGIYGLAVSYTDGSGIVSVSLPDKPVPIAIMKSHVRLAVSFDEHETETTKQNEDTNMKETNR